MSENPLYAKLLEKVVADRPDLAQYAELFQHLSSGDDVEESELENKLRAMELRVRKLNTVAYRMKAHLDDAQDELDELASALGACHFCWGENQRCHLCAGKGSPGFFQPDRAYFDRLVLPALKQMPWIEIKEPT